MSPADRLARPLTLILVGLLLVPAAAALYPVSPTAQEDLAGSRHLPPLSSAHRLTLGNQRTWIVRNLRREGEAYTASRAGLELRIRPERLATNPERRFYLLGTDDLGRDLASRLLHATRRSVLVAGSSVLVAVALGSLVGLIAALAGRHVDAVLMRAIDVLLAIPRLLIVLAIAAALPPSNAALVAVLAALSWPGLARLVRAEAMRLRRVDYIHAARASGCSPWRLAALHVLPQLRTHLVTLGALLFADTVVLESALSFLGFGLPAGAASLGGILGSGRHAIGEAWWVVAFPVVVLGGGVLAVRASFGRPRSGHEVTSVA